MKKYLAVFKAQLATSLQYRIEVIGHVFTWLIATISYILVWVAVYREGGQVGNYDSNEIVSYYLAILLVSFLTEAYISNSTARQIKKGEFVQYLLRPYSIFGDKLAKELAIKVTYLLLPFPIYLTLLSLLVKFVFNLDGFLAFNLMQLTAGIVVSLAGFSLNFLWEYLIAGIAFYVDEVWSFTHLKHTLLSVAGGVSFPLDLVSGSLGLILNFLPFKFIYFIPISYLIGNRSPEAHLIGDLIAIFGWMIFSYLLLKIIWYFGIKRYEAFGN